MHWDFDERAGRQTFRPFGYLGFRYLEVDGAGEALAHGHIGASARHAAMPDIAPATFHSSSATLDAVWNLARHSALYYSQEQFLDTPTREKGQFLGDAENVSTAAMGAFGERALTEQALRDFARSRTRYWPDGRVNAVYPNGDGTRDIPDFTEDTSNGCGAPTSTREPRAAPFALPDDRRDRRLRHGAIDPRTGLVTDLPGGDGDYLHGIVDWPPRCATATTCNRGTHDGQRARRRGVRRRRGCGRRNWSPTRRGRGAARPCSRFDDRDPDAPGARRRTVRRRPRGRRHAEPGRIATGERVRVGVRPRTRRQRTVVARYRRGSRYRDGSDDR